MFDRLASWAGLALFVMGVQDLALGGQDDVKTAPAETEPLSGVRFLCGDWRDSQDGLGLFEEHWSLPAHGSMQGMFRWVGDDGAIRMNELLEITVEGDKPALRIRHFDGKLTPWPTEANGGPLLTLAESGASRALFKNTDANAGLASIEYALKADGHLAAVVSFKDDKRPALKYDFEPIGKGDPNPVTPEQAKAAYDRLKKLVGEWNAESTKGWTEKVEYKLIANGSALMEISHSPDDVGGMATLLHLDGDRLLATHYCGAKNQPRLQLTHVEDDGKLLDFTFLDATNLPSRDKGHMDRLKVRFIDDRTFETQWTWFENGKENWMETIKNVRQ